MDTIIDQFDAADPDTSSDPQTLDIDIDVTFQKRRFTTLHLQEPKAKQIVRAELELNTRDATPWHFRRYQIALIAAVAGVPTEVIGELTNSQLVKAWDFLADQLKPPIPETGET
jgi:hypothetical protein